MCVKPKGHWFSTFGCCVKSFFHSSCMPFKSAMVLFDVQTFLQRHHPGLFLIFQYGQLSVLNAGFILQPTRLVLTLTGSAANRLLFVTLCQPSFILFSMPFLYCGSASKWVSFFQSPRSITASLRATAVRAFLPPCLFANRNPQLFRDDCPRTVVSRQFAASYR